MSVEHGPIPPGQLKKGYQVFILVERLLAAGLIVLALTQTDQSASAGIWGLMLCGAGWFAGSAAWSAYELVAKPVKL